METIIQWVLDTDDSILLFINSLHTPFFDEFMQLTSKKLVWLPMYIALSWVVWKNYNWKILLFCAVGMALTITLSDQIVSSLLRPFFERLRPSNLENPIAPFVHVVEGYRGGRFGFPSAHAANTFGLAFFCLRFFRRRCLSVACFVWAIVVCYSRMYLGVHYFGDLVVGATIGCFCAWAVCAALKRVANLQRPIPRRLVALPIWIGAATFAVFAVWSGISVVFNLSHLT